MPVTTSPLHIESVQAELVLDDVGPIRLSVVWQCRDLITGLLLNVTSSVTPVDPTVFLVQADWDALFADAIGTLGPLTSGDPDDTPPVAL